MSNIRNSESITIRPATAADRPALARVAQRDSGRIPEGDLLVAEADGAVRAAVSIDSGRAVADPFHRTAELVELLRTRAAGVSRPRPLRLIASSPRVERRVAA